MAKPKHLFHAIALIALLLMLNWQTHTLAATFQGIVFNDLNGNRIKDTGEQGLANYTIFIRNNRANQDDGGLYTITSEASGYFASYGHNAANFTLWIEVPEDWEQTTPVAGEDSQDYTVDVAQNQTLLVNFGVQEFSDASTVCDEVTEIPPAQCETLVTLYDNTNGDDWAHNDDWNLTDTPCNWYGVTCRYGQVTGISLQNNKLQGTLPALNALTHLQDISLHNNLLSGSIPDLSALTHLRTLSLYLNQLTGPIPELTALTQLAELQLQTNQLSGPIPELNALINLQKINLNGNKLSGPIPELSNLTQLQNLHLADNLQLSGPIPDLTALTQLQTLSVNNNLLTGPFPDVSTLTQLQWLKLGKNPLTGSIPDLRRLANLQILYLSNTQLSGPIPALAILRKLRQLDLSGSFKLCKNPNTQYGEWAEVDKFPFCPPSANCNNDPRAPNNLCKELATSFPININANEASDNGNDGTEVTLTTDKPKTDLRLDK